MCITLVGLTSLFQFLGVSLGGLGILAVIAELSDDYSRDIPPSVQQIKAKGD